jgi:cell wall-active antibiotic response 4TMS protein YvqF
MRGDQSLIRAIRGPVTLITLGLLFALNNFTPYRFGETWPVLLIVFGVLSLLGRGQAPGTYGYPPPGNYPPPGGYPPQTGYPPPAGYPPQTPYSQSPYASAPQTGETAPPPDTGETR